MNFSHNTDINFMKIDLVEIKLNKTTSKQNFILVITKKQILNKIENNISNNKIIIKIFMKQLFTVFYT